MNTRRRNRPLRAGQRVRIISGILAGFEGSVVERRGSRSLLILKNNPGIFVEIENQKLNSARGRRPPLDTPEGQAQNRDAEGIQPWPELCFDLIPTH